MDSTETKPEKQKKLEQKLIWDLIIVGGGFAGLTAAVYAARAERKVLVLESNLPGGQITTSHLVENWPALPEPISGMDLGNKLEAQAKKLGVTIEWALVDKIDKIEDVFYVKNGDIQYYARALVYATGVSPKPLDIPGELKYRGRGVSYCATCDGAFYKGKEVAIIGGGNAAIEEALYLTKIVSKLYVIHRRDKFRADGILVKKLEELENVEFVLDSVPEEILGDSGMVVGVKARNVKTQQPRDIKVSGVFIYVGNIPNTELLADMVKLNETGYVLSPEDTTTAVPGLFVAGDIRQKFLKQLVTAASDGAVAASMANHYLG